MPSPKKTPKLPLDRIPLEASSLHQIQARLKDLGLEYEAKEFRRLVLLSAWFGYRHLGLGERQGLGWILSEIGHPDPFGPFLVMFGEDVTPDYKLTKSKEVRSLDLPALWTVATYYRRNPRDKVPTDNWAIAVDELRSYYDDLVSDKVEGLPGRSPRSTPLPAALLLPDAVSF